MNYGKLLSAAAIFLISTSASFPVKAQIEQINSANSSTRQVDVTLKTQANQTFNQLIQEAEIQAVDLIEQELANNPKVTEIAVTILGDRQGQQAPLLFARVSRTDWQQQPTIRQWTKYFATSAVLLGFNKLETTPSPQAQSSPRTRPRNVTPPLPTPTRPSNTLPPAPPLPANTPSAPSGASLEESDPGFR